MRHWMSTGTKEAVELLRRPMDPVEYTEIRELWKSHSIAEDSRHIPGLLATLTEDCIYELPQYGERWEGHEGAELFYTSLLGAFPDIDFQLRNITIGPQGVVEEARAVGTHQGEWLGRAGTGEPVDFTVIIYFPWDPARKLFRGERVHVFGVDW
jgi:SnoaL-like polyketide cyclase